MKPPAIPDVPASDFELHRFLSAIKERMELLTGERKGGAAGTATMLPDQSIPTEKIIDGAITRGKLSPYALLPIGAMLDFAGTAAPAGGWLLCDGSTVEQSLYPLLYSVVGTTWNTGGEAAGFFRLPDFRRRVAVGSGGSGTATLGNAVGNIGGEEAHVLTSAELAAHTHTVSGNTGTESNTHVHDGGQNRDGGSGAGDYHVNYASPWQVSLGSGIWLYLISAFGGAFYTDTEHSLHSHAFSVTSGSMGSNTAHNTMQPSAVVLKIIKAK